MKKSLLIVMMVAMIMFILTINIFGVILIYEVIMIISTQGFLETLDGVFAITLAIPLMIGADAVLLYQYLESKEEK